MNGVCPCLGSALGRRDCLAAGVPAFASRVWATSLSWFTYRLSINDSSGAIRVLSGRGTICVRISDEWSMIGRSGVGIVRLEWDCGQRLDGMSDVMKWKDGGRVVEENRCRGKLLKRLHFCLVLTDS